MKLPRWIHHLYANIFGYFWLPCPLCGRKFGGHEWTNDVHIEHASGLNEGICNECARKAKVLFAPDVIVAIDHKTLQPFDTGWRTL